MNASEITSAMATLHPDWKQVGITLQRTFSFSNFVEAFSFMTSVALVAEHLNHHPNWSNVYNTVEVSLSTHDARGITPKDFALAIEMDKLVD